MLASKAAPANILNNHSPVTTRRGTVSYTRPLQRVWYVPQVTRLIGCRTAPSSNVGGDKFIVGEINCDC